MYAKKRNTSRDDDDGDGDAVACSRIIGITKPAASACLLPSYCYIFFSQVKLVPVVEEEEEKNAGPSARLHCIASKRLGHATRTSLAIIWAMSYQLFHITLITVLCIQQHVRKERRPGRRVWGKINQQVEPSSRRNLLWERFLLHLTKQRPTPPFELEQ